MEVTLDSEARLSGNRRGKGKSHPLWWNEDCEASISKRRKELKEYLVCQMRDNLYEYNRVSNKVKRELRRIKSESFNDFCENHDFGKVIRNNLITVSETITRTNSKQDNIFPLIIIPIQFLLNEEMTAFNSLKGKFAHRSTSSH